jgi:putative transcriptional regulator
MQVAALLTDRAAALLRWLGALVLLGAALVTTSAAHAQGVRLQELVGKMLVAAPSMSDPRFRNAVIYVARHDAQGAFGLVVNKPQGVGPLEQVLRAFRLRADPTEARVTIYWGGPVEPGRGFVLHTTDYGTNGALMVAGDLAVSRVESIAVAMAEGRGPRATLMAFGYTNWGAAQLDREVQNGDWVVVSQDHELVFTVPDDTKWRRAYGGFGLDL